LIQPEPLESKNTSKTVTNTTVVRIKSPLSEQIAIDAADRCGVLAQRLQLTMHRTISRNGLMGYRVNGLG